MEITGVSRLFKEVKMENNNSQKFIYNISIGSSGGKWTLLENAIS